LLCNSAAILAAHNHPSGDPAPSPDDAALTTRLAAAGELIGIPLLDHFIIGDGRYYSFRESGRL
jgi:DNA repair protein RadC